MSGAPRILLAIAIVMLFVASMAGDGVFTDAAVFALPWYGAAYHVLKTFVVGLWVNETLAKAIRREVAIYRGEGGEP